MVHKIYPLRGGKHFELIFDDDDIPLLFGYRWIAAKRGRLVYATARFTSGESVYAHRLIMNPPQGDAD